MPSQPFADQLAHLQAHRAALLAQIAQQRGGVLSRAESAAEQFGHPEDSTAQLATERDLAFALGERELAELEAIESAITRIHGGAHGACKDCAAAIAPQRLEVNPEALRCTACQGRHEQAQHAA